MYRLSSPEDVVLHKLLWYRSGYEVSERQWRDVIGVLRVQGDALDRRYMETWATDLGIADLLHRAIDESGPGTEQVIILGQRGVSGAGVRGRLGVDQLRYHRRAIASRIISRSA